MLYTFKRGDVRGTAIYVHKSPKRNKVQKKESPKTKRQFYLQKTQEDVCQNGHLEVVDTGR